MINFNQKIELPTTEISMDGGKAKENPEEKASENEDTGKDQKESSKEKADQKNGNGQEQKAAGV
jgi:hypothetical protein